MLYPILTESRLLSDLSGVWDFKLDNGKGFDEKWYEAPLKDADTMPVPASYNDLKEGVDFRDHYGWVFYQRNISVLYILHPDPLPVSDILCLQRLQRWNVHPSVLRKRSDRSAVWSLPGSGSFSLYDGY